MWQISAESMSDQQVDKAKDMDLKSVPVRTYLDLTVVPLVLQGMSELVKVRPDEPVKWLANYLLENADGEEATSKR